MSTMATERCDLVAKVKFWEKKLIRAKVKRNVQKPQKDSSESELFFCPLLG